MSKVIVACRLAAGLQIEHSGSTIRINGAHVGLDQENLPRNGMMDDSPLRAHGYGLTTLEGDQADAFKEWVKEVTHGPDGKELPAHKQFTPIVNGALKWSATEDGARKAAAEDDGKGVGGLDPAKDLPEGMETADKGDKKKG